MINEYFDIFYGNCGDSVLLIRKSDFVIVEANNKAFELYDIPIENKQSVIGRNFSTFKLSNLSFLSQNEIDAIYKEIKLNGKWSVVLPTKTFNNVPFLAESTVTIIEFEGEEYLVTRTQDVSNKMATKKEIIEVDKSFISILNKLPNGIIIHDKGEILYVNPYFLKSLQIVDNNFQGKSILEIIDKNYVDIITNQIESIEKNELPPVEQIKFRANNNELILFSIQSIGEYYNNKKVVVSILSNLEIQKTLAKESIRAKLAEDANILLEKEIVKHKNTQKELIEMQELTNCMINSSLDMIIASNNEDKITQISPSALYAFGYTEEEIRNISPKSLYADYNEYVSVNKELKENGYFIGEVKNINKEGEIFQSYLSASPIKDKRGNIIGTMGVSRDIQEIKNIEKEIIDSEKRYRELFENLNDAVVVIDENNFIVEINQIGLELFEIESKENIKIFDFFTEEYKEYAKEKSKELIEKGVLKDVELEIITGKGNKKIVDVSSNAIYVDGFYKGSRDIFRDITQKKKKDILLQEQSSKIESIFENSSNVIIWTLDKDFNVSSANKEFLRLFKDKFGATLSVVSNFFDIVREKTNEKFHEEMYALYNKAQSGIPQKFESVLYDINGQKIWFETFLSPIKIVGKDKFDLACLAVDITDKKEVEYELIYSLEEKEVLLKEVHHRVKNNLQVISSILNLQSSYVKDENTLTILRESQNRIKSMSFIHESLYRTKDFSSVDFSEYIDNLTRNLVQSYILEQGGVKINLDLGNYRLNLDQAIPCGLIVNELVSNSMKYAFPAKSGGTISIKLIEKDNILYFEVGDDGIGLPKNLDIENTDTLGLQLVYTLINQLDGNIEVINDNGTKYLFNFTR